MPSTQRLRLVRFDVTSAGNAPRTLRSPCRDGPGAPVRDGTALARVRYDARMAQRSPATVFGPAPPSGTAGRPDPAAAPATDGVGAAWLCVPPLGGRIGG